MCYLARCIVLTAAVLMSSCSLQKFLGLDQDGPPGHPYKSPHTHCAKCHGTEKPRQGIDTVARGVALAAACLECHDYKENHHPVDFVPADPAGIPFPLYEGRITCLTCHEIHDGRGNEGTRKALRGGPYEDRRQICFRCHLQDKYAGINPHKMMDEDGKMREVNGQPVCLLCHSKMPNRETDFTEDVRFRADVGFLCWRCHPPMPDPFFKTHFLVTPSGETLERIESTEVKSNVIIPLIPRGRITCSTCHNPHQKGVLVREAAAKGADSRSKLRFRAICTSCHNY